MKLIPKLFILIMPLIVIWLFIIAIKYPNGDISGIFLDFHLTFNRLAFNVSSNFVDTFTQIKTDFDKVLNGTWFDMLGSFNFGYVNDLFSFFVAVGNFFKGIGLFLYSLVLFIIYGVISIFRVLVSIINLILLIFNFILEPITFSFSY